MKKIMHLENCHSRPEVRFGINSGGNPESARNTLDSRLRGNDRKRYGNDREEPFAIQNMQKKCKKFIGYILIIGIFLVPHLSLAANVGSQCSPNGYTIETINGVFTNKDRAILNRDSLKRFLPDTYNNEPLVIDFLHNPSHLAGVGDILMAVYQKIFDNETVEDYDLIEMLKSASEKVKTQKLLLVAHSQGNFYANSFYDTVAGKLGGVPPESIGVYSVATPSGRVAGGGKWLTSDTDKVIAGVVGRAPFKKIMSPNTHIELQNGDDTNGHNFKDVYLKYRAVEIVSDIRASLDRLSENISQSENKPCISPPELTLAHKLEGVALAVADPVAAAGSDTIAFAGTVGTKATVWTYGAGITAAKTVAQTAIATASSLTAAAKSLTSGAANLAGRSGATVNNANQGLPAPPTPTSVATSKNKTVAVAVSSSSSGEQSKVSPFLSSPSADSAGNSSAPKGEVKAMTEKDSPLKLVFIRPRIYGRGSAPSLAATEETETESVTPEELSSPALSAPQCAESLATDGCLLAALSARFEWAPVSGASYYAISKNGEYAAIAETSLDVTVPNFSDYTFAVAAVGANGRKSATSTKTISVATIPIAINEIAWMGTRASSYDEWLELKNNTGHTISLSGWAIESKDGAPRIALQGSIAPREYLVFERRANTIIADSRIITYGNGSSEWALGNGGEELILSRLSAIFDQTPSDAWAAGNNTSSSSRKTMERYESKESGGNVLNWGTNLDFISNGADADGNNIKGTPGAKNSVSFLINKGRDITENLTLTADEGGFVVPDRISISASSTLTIEPGVAISIYKNSSYGADGEFYVNGIIDARGTAENPITIDSFSGNQTESFWFDDSAGTSTLDYVRFENTKDIGLSNSRLEIRNSDFTNTDGGINAYDGSSVVIENTSFTNMTNDAIGAYGGSVVNIASTTIDGVSGGDGIGAYGGSIINISSTTISNVSGDGMGIYSSTLVIASSSIKNISGGDGIGAYSNSAISIASTTIDEISSGDGVAIYRSTLVIASSTIENISDDGIRLSNSTSTISNTLVQNGGANGIDVSGGTASITETVIVGFAEGAGVLVDSPQSPVAIEGGEITDNSIGVAMTEGDATITPAGAAHDNDIDIVVCAPEGGCP